MSNALALSVAEAAQAAGIGRTMLYNAINRGELPMRKLGKRSLILRSELEGWLQKMPAASTKPKISA